MKNQILREDIEYAVHCDETGKIIGPISKKHAHLPGARTALTHYSTWSMIFHPDTGTYGIQRKNPEKDDALNAGKWDMGAAGHNCYVKEDDVYRPNMFPENLAKEAEEEIGIKIKMVDTAEEFAIAIANLTEPIGYIFEEFLSQPPTDNEWVGMGFVVVLDQAVNFTDNEVVDFKWYTPADLEEYFMNSGEACSSLAVAFEKAEKIRKQYF